MEISIIAAIITGVFSVIAAIITAIVTIYQAKSNKNNVKENSEMSNKSKEYINIPTPKHPTLLNPDEYDIEDENFFITLGGLLQQSRNPKDVTIKKINKDK